MTTNSEIDDSPFTALKAALSSCALLKLSPGSTRHPKLVDGLYYEHRKLPPTWVLSVYRNVKTLGNDVEMAIDPSRLAWPQDDAGPTRRWLETQKKRLQHLESGIHAHQTNNAVRIGLKYEAALKFADTLCTEMAKGTNRWQLEEQAELGISAEAISPTAIDTPKSTPNNLDRKKAAVASNETLSLIAHRMLQTVKVTCAQSGMHSEVIAKCKEWRFRDDQHFLSEVTALLEQAGSRCALSQVSLDLTGERPEFSPSLDRKCSDGHYEPGNLQVVARFVNQWKNDMSDEKFLLLLDAVRNP